MDIINSVLHQITLPLIVIFRYTKTILGHGMDCHLLGLREIANEHGLPMPKIFEHESYGIANHFSLSTSQVTQ